jgi:hypothetical protein
MSSNENFLIYQFPSQIESLQESIGTEAKIDNDVFQNLIDHLKRLKIKTVVVEKEYIDRDYRNEFSHLYCKTFRSYNNLTCRLHFFEAQIADIKIISNSPNQESLGYKGYMIFRPVDAGQVGRTLIPPVLVREGNSEYHLCKVKDKVHLFGKEFKPEGIPFIQQESMVMTCAQASLWMAARYMTLKYAHSEFLPCDITYNATKALGWSGRVLPSEGLTTFQMVNALNNMNFSPILSIRPTLSDYDNNIDRFNKIKKEWNPVSMIYRYVESHIPVIVTVPDHAFVVVGHTFKHDRIRHFLKGRKNSRQSLKANLFPSEYFLDAFIINDDAAGPFVILPVSKEDERQLMREATRDYLPIQVYRRRKQGLLYRTAQDDIDSIIVPLPEKVYLLGQDIDVNVETMIVDNKYKLLNYVFDVAEKGNDNAKKFLKALYSEDNPVITRTYFLPSNAFKESLKQPYNYSISDVLKEAYLNLFMPRFIWIVELSTADLFGKKLQRERKIIGEIIFDSTCNRYSSFPWISAHFPGILVNWKDYDDKKRGMNIVPVPNDDPYNHIIW